MIMHSNPNSIRPIPPRHATHPPSTRLYRKALRDRRNAGGRPVSPSHG